VRRHLYFGWAGLLVFITLGIVLEGLHAFKVPFYLDVENETRRFFFRLAHAHGALLSLVQLGVAGTLSWLRSQRAHANEPLVSTCFLTALVLLPGGFFFAGWSAVAGDPGWGILLVPGGAVFLLVGTFLLVRALRAAA
jgi:hypothetical protein